ncbi:MAG: hypothetical protein Q8L85_08935 [Alphaproteobacteria bacterium]|nr:hypothetical protein [Alphaproteobacteria bacterium]
MKKFTLSLLLAIGLASTSTAAPERLAINEAAIQNHVNFQIMDNELRIQNYTTQIDLLMETYNRHLKNSPVDYEGMERRRLAAFDELRHPIDHGDVDMDDLLDEPDLHGRMEPELRIPSARCNEIFAEINARRQDLANTVRALEEARNIRNQLFNYNNSYIELVNVAQDIEDHPLDNLHNADERELIVEYLTRRINYLNAYIRTHNLFQI